MHQTLAMDQWDGLALSQQLSQVYIHTPLQSPDREEPAAQDRLDAVPENGDDGVNLADQENPFDYICSQDFFCTPDFITPVEQQFPVDFDNKENPRCLRSPRGLTPVRVKRPRPDSIHTQPAWLEDSPPDQLLEGVPLSENAGLPDEAVPGVPLTGKKSQLSHLAVNSTNSRARLPAMRRRAQSPVCLRNPFLEDNADTLQKLKSEARAPVYGQNSTCRYREEFHEMEEIGHGNFSRVFKVLKRVDGCRYAVKRSHHPLRIVSERKQALTEVQALAAVGAHENVVRYHTAWFESDYCYIQMELCDGTLAQLQASDPTVSQECSLLEIMRQMGRALSFIHSKGLVHLDVKPDNIYVLSGTYKLGDFGRATRCDGSLSIEEGDARYMPLEILNDDYTQLTKVDMFALGATIYEIARGSRLPSSAPSFQALRQGKLTLLPGCSLPFQNLLKALMQPTAESRPTADEMLRHSIFLRDAAASPIASSTL